MATVVVTVAEYLALRPFNPADDVSIVDSGANIAALTAVQIAALEGDAVDVLDADDGILTLDAAQFLALGAVTLSADDVVTVADTGAILGALSPTEIATLAGKNVDAIDATDGALTLDTSQLSSLGSVALTQADTVTLSDFGSVLDGGPVEILETLAGLGIDVIDATDNLLTYSVARLNALGTVALTAGDTITLQDTAANFSALSSVQIAALAAKNVDVLDITDAPIAITVEQLLALGGMTFVGAADVSVLDTASNIATLSPAQIAALSGQGIDSIDATDAVRAISISDATIGEGGVATFTVTLSVAAAGLVSVTYGTTNGTASADDFTAANGTIEFAAGETSKTITILTTQDDAVEPDETFNVVLSGATGATVAVGTGIGTITNDDVAPPVVPSISISNAVTTEGGVATFTVTLSEATTAPVSVTYGTSEGTASAADFTAASGTLTFAAGETSKTFTVQTTQDDAVEADETFNVILSAAAGATLGVATGIGTIANDDVTPPVVPSVSISDAVTIEGGVATFTVTLSEATTGPVSVNFGTASGSASVADFIAANGTLTFAAGETSKQIAVQTNQDNLFEGDENFSLLLSNVSGGILADASGVGTILNDDQDGPGSTIGRGTNKSDTIQGSYGRNTINGKGGNDTIFGNGGNDNLFGGDGRDKLYGGNGNDNLQGQNGNDLLFGGEGKDWLKGGDGRDAFAFDTALGRNNVDKIIDFNVRDDSIYLDNAIFAALGSKGSLGSPAKLQSKFFTIGSKAKDSNDHVIYDSKKGVLLYDADGKGGEAAVQFATVSKNLKMTAADFFVI